MENPRLSRLLFILTFLGFSISILSSAGVQVVWIPLENQFGLLQVLPWQFWLGFSICVLSILLGIRIDTKGVFLTKAILLFAMIWGISAFFEENASVWDSYYHFSTTMEVVRTGYIPSFDPNLYTVNWPGAFIFMAESKMVPDIDPHVYMRFFPPLVAALTLAATYLFLRNYISGISTRVAVVVMMFLNVWFQFHTSPQAIGFLLGILTLLSIQRREVEWKILGIVFFAALAISHATTMFAVVATLVCAYFIQRISFWGMEIESKMRTFSNPAILFTVLALSWLFFNALGSSTTLVRALQTQLAQIFLFEERVGGIISARATENIYPIPPNIRMIAIGIFVAISLMFLLYTILSRILSKRSTEKTGTGVFLAIPISFFIVSFLLAAGDILTFGGQFYDRNILAIALISPIFAIGVASLLDHEKRTSGKKKRRKEKSRGRRLGMIFIACISIIAFANFTTVFYQENFYIVSDASFSARGFLDDNAQSETEIEGGMFPPSFEEFAEGVGNFNSSSRPTANILVLDIHTELWRRQWQGITVYEQKVKRSMTMNRTYANGEYEMFWESVTD